MNDTREFYEFTWPGKREAVLEAGRPTDKVLRPSIEDSVNFWATENLYIEGDNLESLKILQRSLMHKVKMIYIDPPYNTGNDFIYNDKFVQDEETAREEFGLFDDEGQRNFTLSHYRENKVSNPRYHSDWCSMMYPRLRIARTLLSDDGVIFISIDDNEQANLRKICDEIFGENNFIATLNIKRRGARADSKYLAIVHEYVLCYANNIASFEVGEQIKAESSYPKYDEQKKRYYKTQLLRKWGTNSRREDRPNLYYPITAPDGSEVYPMLSEGKAGCWRWGKDTMHKAIDDGRVEFTKHGDTWIPYEKIYAPIEGEELTQKYTTWFDDMPNGADTLKKLSIPFDYSKSPELITRLLEIGKVTTDSIILDFFAGSSTTAHAVMSLNASDSGHRKFIMIQLPEPCSKKSEAAKSGYSTIAEIGRERIKRAAKKLLTDSPLTAQQIDSGFRTLKVDSSNFKNVSLLPKNYSQEILDSLISNIKPDRSPLDLLFGVIAELGLPFSMKCSQEIIDGFTILTYGENDIIACFDSAITDEVVREIAKRQPVHAVFRDSCFKNANDRINLEQIFRFYTKTSILRII